LTVDVTGGIGLDLQNWVKVVDENGNPVRNENGDVVLEEAYSVATGTVLTINTKTKKLYNGKRLKDISKAFLLKMEFIKQMVRMLLFW
jgi:aconitate hydratase 2/2-methylisocitrate dehydratase